jgi:succinate dehydrogenase/fumarate reductase cytochrome b subunit
VFVWFFHRLSGVLLIFLLSLQLLTGTFQSSHSQSEFVRAMAGLHKHTVTICVTVFLLVFHGLYGVRTILLDLGIGRERPLFWTCNVLGVILFGSFLVHYLMLVRP